MSSSSSSVAAVAVEAVGGIPDVLRYIIYKYDRDESGMVYSLR